ncbi:hypothetical protein [Pseudomonas lactis]|uniref:hypothetical protein n=1 Tax=Pseudomonas lactis TaxID=1615674 RepID=UPI003F80473B
MKHQHIKYLQDSFELFSDKIKEISSCKRDTQKIFEARQQALHKQLENRKEGGPFDGISSISNFLYYSPSSGEPAMLGAKKTNVDELVERNSLHQLKMYQWLLAEAYEAFEGFLVTAYAYCGLEGISIWKRPENWNHEASQCIQDYYPSRWRKPYDYLKVFREGSQHFARYEMNSPTGTKYKVVFVLIEKLRHLIVHNGGYCKDVKQLVDKMQAELKGVDIKSVRAYVDSYFILHRGDKLIDLLEGPSENDSLPTVMRAYHDPMNEFLRALVEYASLIRESAALQDREDNL